MKMLKGKVALVTGASRGVGRGTAIGLAREGATVVIAARTLSPTSSIGVSTGGSLEEVAAQIVDEGGEAIPVACDLRDANAVEALVGGVLRDLGRIDILVNNAQTHGALTKKFWEIPTSEYDSNMAVSARCYYLATHAAAPAMIEQGGGCIVNISSPGSCFDFFCAPYSISRATADRITQAFAHDLKGTGVRTYSLWPSFIRTERVLAAAAGEDVGIPLPPNFDPASQANSAEMVGTAIAHLAADTDEAERVGTILTLHEVAKKYGLSDVDGRPALRHSSVKTSIEQFGHVVPSVYAKMTY
ncbi:SDR family NAD(P)-dependent oxidoreductase [Rhodobacterales bacterium HKCCSP123]|nr:SDR family NAD(P)-dependent oxidoreductase [Rhodobacterales bacterium HKCCSP123]